MATFAFDNFHHDSSANHGGGGDMGATTYSSSVDYGAAAAVAEGGNSSSPSSSNYYENLLSTIKAKTWATASPATTTTPTTVPSMASSYVSSATTSASASTSTSSSKSNSDSSIPPFTVPSREVTDALLATSMNELSMMEKERALEDLHGVASIQEEDPTYVEECIQQVNDSILSQITASERIVYTMARNQNYEYVTNSKFVIQFLRCECFHIYNTCKRLCKYFELKLELFGKELLTTDIAQKHMTENDLACLNSGYGQLLNTKDNSGRAILCVVPVCSSMWNSTCSGINKLRSSFYILSKAAQDEETQKRGVVGLHCGFGGYGTSTSGQGYNKFESNKSTVWKHVQVSQTLPVRWTALHFCFDDPKLYWMFAMAAVVFEKKTRIRLRCHTGGQVECLYKLMTFGIPAEAFPLTLMGEIRKGPHIEFVRRHRALEEEKERQLSTPSPNNGDIDVPNTATATSNDMDISDNGKGITPTSQDVLLGRGKGFRYHPGNVRFHKIIEAHEERYESANRLGKQILSEAILKLMKDSGSRFLKQDAFGWFVVGDSVARERVAHAFRNRRLTTTSGSSSSGKASNVASLSSSSSTNKSTTKNASNSNRNNKSNNESFSNSASILSTPMEGAGSTTTAPCFGIDITAPWNAFAS